MPIFIHHAPLYALWCQVWLTWGYPSKWQNICIWLSEYISAKLTKNCITKIIPTYECLISYNLIREGCESENVNIFSSECKGIYNTSLGIQCALCHCISDFSPWNATEQHWPCIQTQLLCSAILDLRALCLFLYMLGHMDIRWDRCHLLWEHVSLCGFPCYPVGVCDTLRVCTPLISPSWRIKESIFKRDKTQSTAICLEFGGC